MPGETGVIIQFNRHRIKACDTPLSELSSLSAWVQTPFLPKVTVYKPD